ncbi:hypothetical protein WG954_00720 [Lacibacter sp. H375]|uniref:hypothetical protein n=1 Tax=Lacibacter sp. H375 TaxID=3133424 RepID=UPI0030BEB1FD
MNTEDPATPAWYGTGSLSPSTSLRTGHELHELIRRVNGRSLADGGESLVVSGECLAD